MQATVCKILDFPAAHANSHHDGHCQRMHGHTWTLEIYITGQIEVDSDQPHYGMVVDFQKIKDAYKKIIEPYVEHQNLNETLATVLSEYTTELLACWILSELRKEIPEISKVRLWEGKSSFAEVTPGDLIRGYQFQL